MTVNEIYQSGLKLLENNNIENYEIDLVALGYNLRKYITKIMRIRIAA